MNLTEKKKKLVEQFNINNRAMMGLKQNIERLQTMQIQIQGQLLFIEEMEREQKEEKPKGQKKRK